MNLVTLKVIIGGHVVVVSGLDKTRANNLAQWYKNKYTNYQSNNIRRDK